MPRRILLCSWVILLAFVTPGFADEHFPFLAQVSRESVNVRAGPNTNFAKVDELSKGAQVVVLGHYYEWYKVQPPAGTKVYIRSDYLKVQNGNVFEVLGDNVNVRASASSDSASLGEVKKGTLVQVLGQAQGWSALSPIAGTFVWIHQDFLKEVSDQVPVSMLIPVVPVPSTVITPAQSPATVQTQVATPVSPWVSLRGKVVILVKPLRADVHYEIVLDDKSVFLIQDMPQLDFFCDTVVTIQGAVVPDPQKTLMYSLLHINRISLVL